MREKLKFILSTLVIVVGVAIPVYAVQVGGPGANNGDHDDPWNLQKGEETGQVRILAGDTEVEVEFEDTYDALPVVVLTPTNSLVDDLDYVVKDISNFGFTVEVDHSYEMDVDFSWHAFEVEEGKSYASDGTVEEIEVLMVEAEEGGEIGGIGKLDVEEPDEGGSTDGTIGNEDNAGAEDTSSDSDGGNMDGDDTGGDATIQEGSGEAEDSEGAIDDNSDSDDGNVDGDNTGGDTVQEEEGAGDSGETEFDGGSEPATEEEVVEEPEPLAEEPPAEEPVE